METTDEERDTSLQKYLQQLIKDNEKKRDPNIKRMRLVNRNIGRRTGMLITTVKGLRDVDGLFPMDEFLGESSVDNTLTQQEQLEVLSVSDPPTKPDKAHSKSYVSQSTQYSADRTDANTTSLKDTAISPMSAKLQSSSASTSKKKSSFLQARSTSTRKSFSGALNKSAALKVDKSRKSYVAEDVMEKYVQLISGKKNSEVGKNRRTGEQEQITPKTQVSYIKRRLTFSGNGSMNLSSSEQNEQNSPVKVHSIHPVDQAVETSDHRIRTSKNTSKPSQMNSNQGLSIEDNGKHTAMNESHASRETKFHSLTNRPRSNLSSSSHTKKTASSSSQQALVHYSSSGDEDDSESIDEVPVKTRELRKHQPKFFTSYAESDMEYESSDSIPEIHFSGRKSKTRNRKDEKTYRFDDEKKHITGPGLEHTKQKTRKKSSYSGEINGKTENRTKIEGDSFQDEDISAGKNLATLPEAKKSPELDITQRLKSSVKRRSEMSVMEGGRKSEASMNKTKIHMSRIPDELVSSESEQDVRNVWRRDVEEGDSFKDDDYQKRNSSPMKITIKNNYSARKDLAALPEAEKSPELDKAQRLKSSMKRQSEISVMKSGRKSEASINKTKKHTRRIPDELVSSETEQDVRKVWRKDVEESEAFRYTSLLSRAESPEAQIVNKSGNGNILHIEPNNEVDAPYDDDDDNIGYSTRTRIRARKSTLLNEVMSDQNNKNGKSNSKLRSIRKSIAKSVTKGAKNSTIRKKTHQAVSHTSTEDKESKHTTKVPHRRSSTISNQIIHDNQTDEGSKQSEGQSSVASSKKIELSDKSHDMSKRKSVAPKTRSERGDVEKRRSQRLRKVRLSYAKAPETRKHSSKTKHQHEEEESPTALEKRMQDHDKKGSYIDEVQADIEKSVQNASSRKKESSVKKNGNHTKHSSHNANTLQTWLRTSQASANEERKTEESDYLMDQNSQKVSKDHPTLPGVNESTILFSRGRRRTMYLHEVGGPPASTPRINKAIKRVFNKADLGATNIPVEFEHDAHENVQENHEQYVADEIHSDSTRSTIGDYTIHKEDIATLWPPPKVFTSSSQYSNNDMKSGNKPEKPESKRKEKPSHAKNKANKSQKKEIEKEKSSRVRRRRKIESTVSTESSPKKKHKSDSSSGNKSQKKRKNDYNPVPLLPPPELIIPKPSPEAIRLGLRRSSRVRTRPLHSYLGETLRSEKREDGEMEYSVVQSVVDLYQRKSKVGEGKAKKKKSGKRKSKEPTSEQSPKPQKHYMQSNIEDEETLVPSDKAPSPKQPPLSPEPDVYFAMDETIKSAQTSQHGRNSAQHSAKWSGSRSSESESEISRCFGLNGSETFYGPSGKPIRPGEPVSLTVEIKGEDIFQGKLVINPLGKKKLRNTGNTLLCFYVAEGVTNVTVNDVRRRLEQGSFFRVPRHYYYMVENPSKDQQITLAYTMIQ